jgi:hypothetical protein
MEVKRDGVAMEMVIEAAWIEEVDGGDGCVAAGLEEVIGGEG